MGSNETDEIVKNFLNPFYKIIKSNFAPDSIDLLYYHFQKIGLKRGGSYKDYPKQLKIKKATINSENNDDNCFQYALIVALNYQNIENNPQRISKIKSFIDQYNWKEKDFPSHSKDLHTNQI